eukprot:Skav218896  [mRNA]  locus=scaffold328:249625:250381:+ [translate_table: standard]
MEELEPLDEAVTLPGDWPKLLSNGQIFTALLLSTTYSEKYRGRNMVPWGSAAAVSSESSRGHAELQIPSGERRETGTVRGMFTVNEHVLMVNYWWSMALWSMAFL